MKGKITFNKSGSGSKSARLTIPAIIIELMKITEEEREVEITYKDGKITVEKIKNGKSST